MTKILLIEDEPPVRANLVELLEAEDFDVVSAENGFFGAMWAQKHLPDLIICDVMMPEINGYEVLEALRQEPTTAAIPFIFLTAMADKADIRHGMQLGADDYLTKPFTREELLNAIATRLAKQEAVMQQYNAAQQRAEELQQKVQELQQHVDNKEQLLNQIGRQLSSALPKLNIAIQMVKSLEPGGRRDRCLATLQAACSEELALLNQIPNIEKLFPPESLSLLYEFNLVSRETRL